MHNYYFKIEVEGRARFPIDQLRRYELFPVDSYTADEIESSLTNEGTDRPVRIYTFGMYASSLAADGPMAARFASFGLCSKTLEVWKDDKLVYLNGLGAPFVATA